MFSETSLWEGKLNYLKDQLEQVEGLPRAWYGPDQFALWNETRNKLKKKIGEYERLVEYLKEGEEE